MRIKEALTDAQSLRAFASGDLPSLGNLFSASGAGRKFDNRTFDLRTRMLFSCLVDADRIDSAGSDSNSRPLRPEERFATLLDHLDQLSQQSSAGVVNSARRNVLTDCLNGAEFPDRLLSLTVPTGGGKTLAAMAFALKRAKINPDLYRRIIVVIPYLSIIEQNASVYSRIFGADGVLEHHSGSFDRLRRVDREHFVPDEAGQEEAAYRRMPLRNPTENWSEPMIVTTSVRFFESLFSNRPSDLRRVHNIARSIVILDEVQTLPRSLLSPLLRMIRELSEDWGCTFVFSTATQPAFQKRPAAVLNRDDHRWEPGTVREIIQDPGQLRRVLKRVVIEWELERTTTWPELASRLIDEPSVLCVVNLREHASVLFDALLAEGAARGLAGLEQECFHLSTRMCAAHRLVVLAEIRNRLASQLPCRVISTQLIEAGVDVDFPIAFRALGPLDAIFQVAGRVDREGKLTAALGSPAGRLIVFRSPDEKTPPQEYSEATMRTSALAGAALNLGKPIQPESVEEMETFWQRFYGEANQGHKLQAYRECMKFSTLAKEFEMISNRTQDIFVPYDDVARDALAKLRVIGQLTNDLRHRLQRYVVGLQPYEFEKAKAVFEEIGNEPSIWAAVERGYSEIKGLKLSLSAEDTIS